MPGPCPRQFEEILGSPSLREAIVESLARAYDTAVELHDPTRGSNETTFGVGLYHYAVFELETLADDSDLKVELVNHIPFRLIASKTFTLGCHRVGRTSTDDIWTSFPGNAGAAATLIPEAYLPGDGFAPDTLEARTLVIAHMGNPEDGLCAVYFCVPTREENGRIREWGFADLVWTRTEASVASTGASASSPEEVVDGVPLATKKSKPKVERE